MLRMKKYKTLGPSLVFVLNTRLGSRAEGVFQRKDEKASRELKLKLKLPKCCIETDGPTDKKY